MPGTLQVEQVCYSFGVAAPFLRDVSFSAAEGETLAIVGKSGHCKTALLDICAGLLSPASGRVRWDGRDIAEMTKAELYLGRREMGRLFQQHALISNLTVFDNIALPLRYYGECHEDEIEARVRHTMDECGLFNVEKRFPETLSASQLRGAALARALINEPRLLLLDEPTAGLDQVTGAGIVNILREVHESLRPAMVIVSADVRVIRAVEARIAVLDSGVLRSYEEQCHDGDAPYIATLLKQDYEHVDHEHDPPG